MRKKLEKTCEKNVTDYAWKTAGAEGIKMNMQCRNHMPDRMYLFTDAFILWIEFKRDGEEPTPAQWNEIRRLRGLGHGVAVCDNKEDGRACIDWSKAQCAGGIVKALTRDVAEAARRCLTRDHTAKGCTIKGCVTCAADRAKAMGAKTLPAPGSALRARGRQRSDMG